ncbi:MAG TPA: hypothetical protein VIF09_14235 [Polyangiaceae bacterium]|jgi:hypothetical protein
MRAWNIAVLVFVVGCTSGGTETAVDAGDGGGASDATTLDAISDDGGGPASDAGDDSEASGQPPCVAYGDAGRGPSDDCVYSGRCPFDCVGGTASAYACAAGPGPTAEYPSAFTLPAEIVHVVDFQPSAYPWDAAAFVSCAPLACVRWATADHVDGGSAWGGDPCSDGGAATEAWACPTLPGVQPAGIGCFNAGDSQRIGGPGTGVDENVVWCCPPAAPGDAGGAEASTDAGADAAAD